MRPSDDEQQADTEPAVAAPPTNLKPDPDAGWAGNSGGIVM